MNRELFFESAGDERGTPKEFFDRLDAEFHFTLDAAASKENAKCDLYFGFGSDLGTDALEADWGGEGSVVWLNPPYSVAGAFVAKAREEADKGAVVVLLLPARTDTRWWHSYVQPFSGLETPWFSTTQGLAWAAGIVDGEGCIGVYANHPDKGDHLMYLRLTVNNTDSNMLDRLQKVLGVGNIRKAREADSKHKAAWCWECNSEEAARALRYLYPFLLTKQRQADLALQFFHTARTPTEKRVLMEAVAAEKAIQPSRPGLLSRVRFVPGRLSFELNVPPAMRQLVKDEFAQFDPVMQSEQLLVQKLVDLTGLPAMAIRGIVEDKPDEDLLSSAPFPSAVVIFRSVQHEQ